MYRALAELHTRSIFARCCNFSLSRETGRQIHSTAKDRLSAEAIPDTGSNVSASDLYLSLSLSCYREATPPTTHTRWLRSKLLEILKGSMKTKHNFVKLERSTKFSSIPTTKDVFFLIKRNGRNIENSNFALQ